MRALLAAAAFSLLAACGAPAEKTEPVAAAEAQTQSPMAGIQRLAGEVAAITDTHISLRGEDGQITELAFAPEWILVIGKAIDASEIKPGDFVATANENVGESGRSVELRVFPPGLRLGEGSYPMPDGNTMTNGDLAEITEATGGRDMVVRFPGGERRITLPADVVVVGQSLGDKATIRPGWRVRAFARPDEAGVLTTGYIYAGENGAAPPGL